MRCTWQEQQTAGLTLKWNKHCDIHIRSDAHRKGSDSGWILAIEGEGEGRTCIFIQKHRNSTFHRSLLCSSASASNQPIMVNHSQPKSYKAPMKRRWSKKDRSSATDNRLVQREGVCSWNLDICWSRDTHRHDNTAMKSEKLERWALWGWGSELLLDWDGRRGL